MAKLKVSINKWGLCIKITSYCGIVGCAIGILSAAWMRFNAEQWVVMLDTMKKDQSNSDVVTKDDWVLAADMRAISLVGIIAMCICLKAMCVGLKIAKADVDKMCQKEETQPEGQQQNQRKKCRGMKKGMFKWFRPRIARTMVPLIVCAIIGVMYEKKIWNEIDPLSDKWAWSDKSFYEAEEARWEDDVKEWEDDVDSWEDDVMEDTDDIVYGFEDSFFEERTMD
jgi:hypothetical protein